MATDRAEPSRDRIPDPAALAQGHRLLRLASGLELPAWMCGALALLLLLLSSLTTKQIETFAMAGTLTVALGRLAWSSARTPSMRATSPGPRLPGEIHDLLALVDSLIDTLERGKDRLFNTDMNALRVALDGLGPEACRYLEERGADRARLRHGLSWSEDGLLADQRRALHHELLRFSLATRGRPCGDPYRSRMSDGPTLLAVVRDPSLARMRRRCAGLLLCVIVIWMAVARGVTALQTRGSRLCNPWGDNLDCGFEIDLAVELELLQMMLPHLDPWLVSIFGVALVPVFLLLAAHVAREAGWRSFAAALPEADALPTALGRPLRRARRRERALRWLWAAGAWLVCGCTVDILLVAHDWDHRGFTLTDRIIVIGLVTLAAVLIPTLTARFVRGRELLRLERWSDRAPHSAPLLTELFELRSELEQAAPVRAELLEQLAQALEQANSLGRLSTQDRDRVVARLRAGADRGPALEREQLESLLLDVRACEASIGAGAN